MTPEVNNENATAATGSQEEILQEAVQIASDLLVVNRDQKNTAIVLAGMTADEKAAIKNFITRVNAQANANKNVYALIQAQAKTRNAGKTPRARKAKTADTGTAASTKK